MRNPSVKAINLFMIAALALGSVQISNAKETTAAKEKKALFKQLVAEYKKTRALAKLAKEKKASPAQLKELKKRRRKIIRKAIVAGIVVALLVAVGVFAAQSRQAQQPTMTASEAINASDTKEKEEEKKPLTKEEEKIVKEEEEEVAEEPTCPADITANTLVSLVESALREDQDRLKQMIPLCKDKLTEHDWIKIYRTAYKKYKKDLLQIIFENAPSSAKVELANENSIADMVADWGHKGISVTTIQAMVPIMQGWQVPQKPDTDGTRLYSIVNDSGLHVETREQLAKIMLDLGIRDEDAKTAAQKTKKLKVLFDRYE